MNNDTGGWTETGRTTFTSTDGASLVNFTTDGTSTLNFTVNTLWNLIDYYVWPKGVSDYSTEQKYKPKWHITEGYKNQMDSMWK